VYKISKLKTLSTDSGGLCLCYPRGVLLVW